MGRAPSITIASRIATSTSALVVILAHAVTRAAGVGVRGAVGSTVLAASEGQGRAAAPHDRQGLIATLPHHTGGPRQASGKLYLQPAPLSLPQLQTRVREFIDAYNTEHQRASLGGLMPAE